MVYQVQIVSTGELNPQPDVAASSAKTPSEPKKKTVKPKKVPKKAVVKPKKVKPHRKKERKPKKKVAPKKKTVVKPKRMVPKKKKAPVKQKRKVRTAAEVRRDFLKNSKPEKQTRKRRDLSHLLNDKKVSAKDISKRFSKAMNKVKVSPSQSDKSSNYNYSNYYSGLSSYLYGRWKEPRLPQNYETTIEVTISKWGTVLKKRIIKHSGNTIMDNSIQRMLSNLTKLPKLPSTSQDDKLTIQITLKLEN